MKRLIRGGRLIDPSQNLDRIGDLWIEDGRILGYDGDRGEADDVLDADGCVVAPGLIDLNAEFRDPGWEEDETIDTAVAAAVAGGFTGVACTPNTNPPIDTQASVQYVLRKASRAAKCRVFVLACVSKNREGQELAEIGSLVEAGAVGFTDANQPLHNTELLRRALEYCAMFDRPIMNHPEVRELTHRGVMHEGHTSMVLGLGGMPAESEDVMTSRDLRLAEATGGRLHLMNISSAGSVELIRRAKDRGVNVTAEVTPMHFALTDDRLRTFDTNYKVNPPLRTRDHVAACIEGLRDGTLDAISSGHSPRAREKKMLELDQAPFGVSSLETVLAMTVTHLIEPGHLDWPQAIAKLTTQPARVLGVEYGTLQEGAAADVVVIDPQHRWTVRSTAFHSKSGNTPLDGETLQGRAIATLVDGELRYRAPATAAT